MKIKPLKALKSLLGKSVEVQRHIDDEMSKKSPDWFRVITLKKQRLTIKDKIHKLRRMRRAGRDAKA